MTSRPSDNSIGESDPLAIRRPTDNRCDWKAAPAQRIRVERNFLSGPPRAGTT